MKWVLVDFLLIILSHVFLKTVYVSNAMVLILRRSINYVFLLKTFVKKSGGNWTSQQE